MIRRDCIREKVRSNAIYRRRVYKRHAIPLKMSGVHYFILFYFVWVSYLLTFCKKIARHLRISQLQYRFSKVNCNWKNIQEISWYVSVVCLDFGIDGVPSLFLFSSNSLFWTPCILDSQTFWFSHFPLFFSWYADVLWAKECC